MNVSELGELFEIIEYQPDISGRATVELVNGALRIRIPYHFYSVGDNVSPEIMVKGKATAQQLQAIRQNLIQVLQATNAAIESEHGWTKYSD